MTLSIRTLCGAVCGVILSAALTSCSDSWSVSGNIEDTDNTTVYLESQNRYGQWTPVDSAQVSGSFSFSRPALERPDIYRLNIDGHYIYFPVERDDDIAVNAAMATADIRSTISGSTQADLMHTANTYIADILDHEDDKAVTDSLKRCLYTDCLAADTLGLVSYYVVTKRVDGRPIYDPTVRRELGIIGAVANSFATRRPDDPRTGLLNDYFLRNRPKGTATVQAQEVAVPEITLTDENGKTRTLTDELGEHKAVVLNFTVYAAENSGNVNMGLREVYNALHDSGMQIYQVDVMSDRSLWRHTAVNLPWTTVYLENNAQGLKVLTDYQVNADRLPLTFVVTADDITRVDDLSRLRQTVASKL